MKGRVVVLGAGGFIGRRIVERLACPKVEAVVGYTSRQCDLLAPEAMAQALADLGPGDVVVVAAAITRLQENSYQSMLKNIEMIENFCQLVRSRPVAQVIFLSTVDVYGLLPAGGRIHEGLVPAPNDWYAIAKLTSEYILRNTLAEQAIPLTVLRLTGIYGPGDQGKSTISALAKAGRERGAVAVFGAGDDLRDFVHVDDLCGLIVLAIDHRTDATVNVATGRSLPVGEIARLVCESLGPDCVLEFRPPPPVTAQRIKHMEYDVSLLRQTFPEMQFTPLEEGVREYLRC